MRKIKEQSRSVNEKEITSIVNLLGARFNDNGVITEVKFPLYQGNNVHNQKINLDTSVLDDDEFDILPDKFESFVLYCEKLVGNARISVINKI